MGAQMLALHQADIRYGGAFWDVPNLIIGFNIFLLSCVLLLYLFCMGSYLKLVFSGVGAPDPIETLMRQSKGDQQNQTAEYKTGIFTKFWQAKMLLLRNSSHYVYFLF